MMGTNDPPNHVNQEVIWSKGIALGYIRKPKNSFGWEIVITNLTGTTAYDRRLPWVYKERRDGIIEDEIFVYM